ncbi:MAG: AraC family transcriptional regulator [Tepidisphaeraceae bacterium]
MAQAPEAIKIVWQNFSDSPIGRVSKAAFISHSRGISRMRVLRSYALVYLLEGKGRFDDALGMSASVSPGDLILLFPDVAHRYGPRDDEDWSEFYILFEGPVFDQWRASGLLDPARPIHHMEPIGYWVRRLQGAVEPPTGARQLYPLASVCKLQQALADVFIAADEGRINPEDRQWLDRACALLEQPSPPEQIDWNEIAAQLHMSYENFRKRFARLAGMPPSKYRMRRVMEHAAEHLLQSRLTLKEVADLCGFCNEFHFSRRFKQIVGVSPRDFRRQLPH